MLVLWALSAASATAATPAATPRFTDVEVSTWAEPGSGTSHLPAGTGGEFDGALLDLTGAGLLLAVVAVTCLVMALHAVLATRDSSTEVR